VATSANSPTEASVSSKGRLTLCLTMVLRLVLIDLVMVIPLVMGPIHGMWGGTRHISVPTPIYWTCTHFLKYPIEFYCTRVPVCFSGSSG